MYFQVKNTLKNTRYHTFKLPFHPFNLEPNTTRLKPKAKIKGEIIAIFFCFYLIRKPFSI
jgi:hypothetical protein